MGLDLDFTPVIESFPALLDGTMITISVTIISLIIACVIGMLIGVVRSNGNSVLSCFFNVYVSVIRGTPLLVQLFIWYYGLPRVGIMLPSFLCGILGLSLYSSAYISEIVRGAIQSIEKGQMEAARSLGMSKRQGMTKIIIPQAIVRMLPPLGNEFIALIKNSALISLITIHDLMHEGTNIISTSYRDLETYLVIAVIYFVLTNISTFILRSFENRQLKSQAN
ncbi:amino acid ABC transporter permease [Psychromonas sp. RZ22]|uniref:amino acid ABC transporter permease n=1 Tax=Psychromonas algarum TaxID=2555643 RepID=UPI001067DABD|nr:amino acid ABC transporter permease [Psychromonas sp. RZ22]TEW56826.1 amino acid ABC transporter permease [Psychromonas sp. RZ22]